MLLILKVRMEALNIKIYKSHFVLQLPTLTCPKIRLINGSKQKHSRELENRSSFQNFHILKKVLYLLDNGGSDSIFDSHTGHIGIIQVKVAKNFLCV